MNDTDRFKLRFGQYKTPRYRIGSTVVCEVLGDVVIVGTSDGRIPWPLGRRKGRRGRSSLVVYRGLAKAVRRESNIAIRHWWGVGQSSMWKWRRSLGVPSSNEGTHALLSDYSREPGVKEGLRRAVAKARDPERRAKIAASRRGKKRPASVLEALRKANTGRRPSEETRRKMSEAHRRRGTRPPWLNPAWTAEEDSLLRTLTPKEVAERTGRTVTAVRARRLLLKRKADR